MLRNKTNPFPHLIMAALAAMLSACAVGPNYHAPKLAVPEAFDAASALAPAATKGASPMASSKGSAAAVIDARTWWRSFGDPELDSLVERAIKSNPDIEIALDRLPGGTNG